nr:hypothetical protein [Tanacetum cinerariifolium]
MMGRVGPTGVSPTFGMLTVQRASRDRVQLETTVNTITHEYLLEFTSQYDGMPASGTYSVEAVRALDTHRTPLQKQPEALLFLVEMDLFSLIRALNPTKVKTRSRPRAPHELPLLTLTAPRVIEMDEPAAATDSSGVPSAIEKSLLDFANEAEAFDQETAAPEVPPPEVVPITTVPGGDQAAVAVEPPTVQESHKSGREGVDANAPSKSLRRDHADLQPSGVPADVSDPDPLAFADAPSPYPADVIRSSQGVAATGDPGSENVSSPTEVGSPRSVAMGSQLRLRFEHEAKLLQKSVAQVDALQHQVPGEETLKAAFEDYKRQQDQMVEQRSAEMDARLDAMSIDFDEELYPHMLTAIAGRRWVIGYRLRLATMKCAESLEMRQAFADVSLEAYDSEAEAKFVAALQSLKDLKLPLLDQLEGLKDAPMDVIMASLYLKDDTGDDALQFIRDLRPSSFQLAIPIYPEVRDPRNPWGCTEETKLANAIAANISRAEQKKRSRIVYRTHGVGSAHHARSDRVPVSAPIVVPQVLALILVDAATQTDPDA